MSTKSTAEKLLIKPATTVWTSHPKRLTLIEPAPERVRVANRPEQARSAIIFGADAESLRSIVDAHAERLADAETVWVVYPKGDHSDINHDGMWPILAVRYMHPIGQVSLDHEWSAMRFRPRGPGEATFMAAAA
jgi:hypothetical protein